MSLMQLLSAGKTLVSGGEPSGRYRINTGYHLPKFGSTKNPFQKPAEVKPAAQVEMQMPAPILKEEENVRLSSAELSVAKLKETQPVAVPPAEVQATEVTVAPVAAPAQEKVHPLLAMLDWMDDTAVLVKQKVVKMELSKLIPKRKPAAPVPVVAKAVPGPLQPELSLEKVRVLRNDLSDSDLEIVTVKTEAKAEVKTKSQVVRPESTEVEFNRMEAAPELIGVVE